MKHKVVQYFATFFALVALTACTQSELPSTVPTDIGYPIENNSNVNPSNAYPVLPNDNQIFTQVPLVISKPKPGKGAVSGVLYSYTSDMLLPGTMFYLTSAVDEANEVISPILVGPLPEKGDIVSVTNDDGEFTITDISPGKYYFIVSAPYSWQVVVKSDEDQTAQIFEVQADTKFDLGMLPLSWP